MKKKFIIFFLLLVYSCDDVKNLTTKDFTPKNKAKEFEHLYHPISFNSLFSVVDSIRLETSKESFMGKPWSVIIDNKNIIVLDLIYSNKLYIFSKGGKFINTIGNIGEGPGEYKSPSMIAMRDNKLFVYDPALFRVTVFDIYNQKYLYNWKVKKYYESVTTIDKFIIFLNRYGQGYTDDFEVFDLQGGSIYGDSFPRSLSENKRNFLFGSSFLISNCKNKLVYIGADEYKLISYDIFSRSIEWASNIIPPELKLPDLPQDIRKKGPKWLKENYSPLYNLFSFKNGLIVVQADDYFFLYDYNGNYINSIFNKNRRNFFTTDGIYLYEIFDPYQDKNGNLLNSKVYIYKLNIIENLD